MQVKVRNFVALCAEREVDVLIYCTLRTPAEQARLYRQGRNIRTIRGKAQELRQWNPALADLLMDVGPQYGPKVTAAGPGQSYHQYGYAADGVPLRGGKPMWDASAPEWRIYGDCARAAKLEWAGDWNRGREYPHVQMPGRDWRKMIRGLKV